VSIIGTEGFASAVKRFFRFLDRRSLILHNPAEHIRLPRARRLPPFVPTPKQVERLLELPPVGIRPRDERPSDPRDLLRNRCSHGRVPSHRRGRRRPAEASALRALGKGKEGPGPSDSPENAPCSRSIRPERSPRAAPRPEAAGFVPEPYRRAHRQDHAREDRPGLRCRGRHPRLHAHSLRHACATHLLQGGADIAHVQKILGHSQITTTAEYVKVAIGDLKKVVEKKHPREKQYRRKK